MSTLENTISILELLPEADLLKIQEFAKKLSRNYKPEAAGRFLKPMSAEDFMRDIEAAEKQYAAGEYRSAEEVFDGLERRYRFTICRIMRIY